MKLRYILISLLLLSSSSYAHFWSKKPGAEKTDAAMKNRNFFSKPYAGVEVTSESDSNLDTSIILGADITNNIYTRFKGIHTKDAEYTQLLALGYRINFKKIIPYAELKYHNKTDSEFSDWKDNMDYDIGLRVRFKDSYSLFAEGNGTLNSGNRCYRLGGDRNFNNNWNIGAYYKTSGADPSSFSVRAYYNF